MRLPPVLVSIAAFVLAAGTCMLAARIAVKELESRSVDAVQIALETRGNGWASVLGDGLQVIIEGEAPNEAERFRAISVAGSVVDASRVIDNMQVKASAEIGPPEFSMEILRGESGVSLIGLIPASTEREVLIAEIERATGDEVADLLDVAEHPAPDGWRRAVAYAIRALATLELSKVSVTAGHVDVSGIADSEEERTQLQRQLTRSLPEGVTVNVAISAPRPVITPFALRFVEDDAGARFESCVADTAEAAAAILAAGRARGAAAGTECTLGIGAPTAEWGEAVARAIAAIGQLGGGTLTFSDGDVSLVAPAGTLQTNFDRITGELDNALPGIFVLSATLPSASEAEEGPPLFTATRSPEGTVQLRGRVESDLMNDTAADFARASFSNADVTMGTRVSGNLPAGWTIRVLAAIEALSMLSSGAVIVEPDQVTVRGKTGNQSAEEEVARLLIDKLGPDAVLNIAIEYVEALDPIAALPTPEECVAHIRAVTGERKILFDPGSATLTAASQTLVDDIAEVLRSCPDLPLEIAGYTDSQGRDEMNLNLSQDRADAILTALRARRVPVMGYQATGYGEADPIADNETEEGREANRRIEFRLILPEAEPPTGLERVEGEGEAGEGAPGEDASGEGVDEDGAGAGTGEGGVDTGGIRPRARAGSAVDDAAGSAD